MGESHKLTKTLVEGLRCEPYTDAQGRERFRDVKVFDSEVPGFFVRLQSPKGRPTYYLQYRNRARQLRRLPLGKHTTEFTVKKARTAAARELVRVRAGADPVEKRRAERSAATFKELAELWFERLKETGPSERGVREARRLLDSKLLPAFGSRVWRSISVTDVTRWHGAMKESPVEANRALGRLSAILNTGQKVEPRADWINPCSAVSRYREKKRERFLSEAELARLGEALAQIEDERTTLPSVMPFFGFLS